VTVFSLYGRGIMESDIRLDQHLVIIEATDLILDAPERRAPDAPVGGYRRALVHGPNDQLIINYDGDYPGGVLIQGRVHLAGLDPRAASTSSDGRFQHLEKPQGERAEQLKQRLEQLVRSDQPGGTLGTKLPVDIAEMFANVKSSADLIAEIRRLRLAILVLDQRVKALEAKP
jgi:hypothetical protein